MTTSKDEIYIDPSTNSVQRKIFLSMSTLLGRAGLNYQGRYVEVGGNRIHYLEYGSGAPVLLLHGGGAGSAIWFHQIEALAKTHRVVVPDHPVFGLSSQSAYESPFLDSAVSYIIDFMDILNISSADVIGLSLGAQMAMATAIKFPHKVRKIIVIDSAGLGKEFPILYMLANLPLIGRVILRSNKWAQDMYFKTMEVDNSDFEDAVYYKQYAYDVTLMDGHTAALRSSLKGVTGFAGQKSIFTDDELRSLSSPVLALWGAEDPVFPVEHGYRLARLVPSCHLHVFENAKHVPLLDHPFEVNDLLLGFLAEG